MNFPRTRSSVQRLKASWRALLRDGRRYRAIDHIAKAGRLWPINNQGDVEVQRALLNALNAMATVLRSERKT